MAFSSATFRPYDPSFLPPNPTASSIDSAAFAPNFLFSIEVRGLKSHSNPKSGSSLSSKEALFPYPSIVNNSRLFAKNAKWSCHAELDHGSGAGDGGGSPGGGGGGGNGDRGGDDDEDDREEAEFGPLWKFEEVMREVEARGASLPSDKLEAAKTTGIRRDFLFRYLDLTGGALATGCFDELLRDVSESDARRSFISF